MTFFLDYLVPTSYINDMTLNNQELASWGNSLTLGDEVVLGCVSPWKKIPSKDYVLVVKITPTKVLIKCLEDLSGCDPFGFSLYRTTGGLSKKADSGRRMWPKTAEFLAALKPETFAWTDF